MLPFRLRSLAFAVATLACGCGGAEPASTQQLSDAAPDSYVSDAGTSDRSVCVAQTCASLSAPACGKAPDGCGGVISCGDCAAGFACGAGGPNRCGTGLCAPKSCQQLGASCGTVSDGCSSVLDCGACPLPSTCAGGGKDNQCGCAAKTCAELGAKCGEAIDGCTGKVACGACKQGETCGAGGPNQCAIGSCTPKTCSQLGAACGLVSDGCAGVLDCGTCPGGEACGGAGKANQCGCTSSTCEQLGATCGDVFDGCKTVKCGNCTLLDTCGGGGISNRCGCQCQRDHATAACLQGVCGIQTCNSGWGNCDGVDENGCETPTDQNMSHCGACGASCAFEHTNATCQSGACAITGCEPGYGDCDENSNNGCEANTASNPNHCGSCTQACSGINAMCVQGVCGTSSCPSGLGDCDPNVTGCETDLGSSTQHCGVCDNPCGFPHASANCNNGQCVVGSCETWFSDCDGLPANGCEASVEAWCGYCQAPDRPHCSETQCVSALVLLCTGCEPGWGNCNGIHGDGCETQTNTPTNCGSCGGQCQPPHSTADCSSGSCQHGVCDANWADCDGSAPNGCETDLSQTCGYGCALPDRPHCSSTLCTSPYVYLCMECEAGWMNCNGIHDDGCEVNGSCG